MLESAMFPLLVLSGFAAAVIGIRRYRPAIVWPFVCIETMFLLF
jgi:hypothetical protein